MTVRTSITQYWISVMIVVSVFLFAGCASSGIPAADRISGAETAINEAWESNAKAYAPLELKLAEDKLQEAKAAYTKERFVEAQQLAEKATVDAKLAEARAQRQKTKEQVDELRDTVDALQDEIDRVQQAE